MKTNTYIYLKSADIDRAVRSLYSKNGYTVLSQVRNGTGFERSARTADMLAISTWPSRGLFIEGFEIKTSRSDLQRELAEPAKADNIAKYCTQWWLAVTKDLVTDLMLVPETWGIITVDEKLKPTIVRRGAALTPAPMDALLVCAILRNFAESYVPLADIEERVKSAQEVARKNAESLAESRLKKLETAFQEFKESSGVDLMERNHPSCNMRGIGEAVKLVTNLRHSPVNEILSAKRSLMDSVAAIDSALGILDTSEKIA